jgi:hypothetical protein
MAIVAIYKEGSCTVTIHDDYATYDETEIQKILDRIGDIYTKYLPKSRLDQLARNNKGDGSER